MSSIMSVHNLLALTKYKWELLLLLKWLHYVRNIEWHGMYIEGVRTVFIF